jgi:hypothetical protein
MGQGVGVTGEISGGIRHTSGLLSETHMDGMWSLLRAVIVNKKRGAETRMYKVVDNVTTMTPDHWDRVVACFVAGPEWQFKKWPMFESGGTAQLFSKVGSCSV